MDSPDKNKIMFIQIVAMFQTAALQQMGKLKNPVTEKVEKDLQQAQLSIDILDMFKEKTKGNLSPDEERFLSNILQDLKLNYVDELTKDAQQPKVDEAAAQPSASTTAQEAAQ
jgi:Domain of unknown function (DUF1844)